MNWYNFFILSTLVISQKLFLINEEFLILVCFILFSVISYYNLSSSISNFFKHEIESIEKNIVDSFRQYISLIFIKLKFNKKFKNLNPGFIKLKKYFYFINFEILENLHKVQNFRKINNFRTKLTFIRDSEDQILKIIFVLLLEKITKITLVSNF